MTNEKDTAAPLKMNWTDQKVKLKERFANLTDADLKYEDGKKDEMMAKIQTKLGKTKEEFEKIIETL